MKTLSIEAYSEAEKYFVNKLLPIAKDGVKVFLGAIVGVPVNEYTISDEDFLRIRHYIHEKNKKRKES